MVLLVAVLGVGELKQTERQKGVFRGTAVEESEGVFHVDFVDVAGGSVGLFAQVGPVALAEVVEEGFFRADFGLDPELADEPGTVSRGAQGRGVAGLEVGRANGRCAEREPVGALGETGENGRPAGGAIDVVTNAFWKRTPCCWTMTGSPRCLAICGILAGQDIYLGTHSLFG